MRATPSDRVAHMKAAIDNIRRLRASASDEEIGNDAIKRAALERFFEIVSEASRHIPEADRAAFPDIAWKQIAAIGNILRHAYDGIDLGLLLSIADRDLDGLEAVLGAMSAKYA